MRIVNGCAPAWSRARAVTVAWLSTLDMTVSLFAYETVIALLRFLPLPDPTIAQFCRFCGLLGCGT
jgi:hypothetical protein